MSESCKPDDACTPLDECCLRLAQERLSAEVGAAAGAAAGGAQGVFTLEAETSRIVVANDAGCSILGFNVGEMHLTRFSALFVRPEQWSKAATLCYPQQFADFAGKVVSLRGKGGNPVTVSLSLHPLPLPHTGTLAVITPALSNSATVTVDLEGCISQMDEGAEHMFRCAEGVLRGEPVSRIIPQLPPVSVWTEEGGQLSGKKLRHVGNTEDDAATKFPLSLRVTRLENVDLQSHCYQLAIQALPKLRGMMIVDACKIIVFCSQQLVVNLFGFSRTELVGRPVTLVIPDFCESQRQDFTQLAVLWETEDQRSRSSPESLPYYRTQSEASWHEGEVEVEGEAATSDEDTPREFCTAESSMGRDRESPAHAEPGSSEPTEDFSLDADDLSDSSDEFISAERTLLPVRQGFFCGSGLHKDQTSIDIRYRVGQTKLCHSCVSLVWVEFGAHGEQGSSSRASRSSRSSRASRTSRTSRTSRASHSAASTQLSSLTDSTTDHTEDRVRTCSRLEGFADAALVAGGYGQLFINTRHIGSGSFGVVKLARSKLDSHAVVSKFICKSKLDPTFVVEDPELGTAPMELVILRQLNHPGVVSVEKVFQNDDFFILVMEHGQPTMDLFEFFSSVNADASLTCHIFQQVSRAVQYLDSKSIVHRDLKDENMIIDLSFRVKLVDFGSAAFFGPGTLFCTFFGTPPYCSPEVLLGNSYAGPELEVWSLGVVLFTMSFGHFPFPDVASTVRGGLRFPDLGLDVQANPDLKPDPDPKPDPDLLRALLREMLHPCAEQRICIGGVVQHPWCAHVCQLDNYSLPELLARGARDQDAEVSSYESGGQSLSELRDLITSCESLSDSDSGGSFSPSSTATATATVGNLDSELGSDSDRSLQDSPPRGSEQVSI